MASYEVVGTYTSGANIQDAVVVGSEIFAYFRSTSAGIRLRRIDPVALTDIALGTSVTAGARLAYDGTHVWMTRDSTTNLIYRYDPTAFTETTFAGSTGGFSNFRRAEGIAFDGSLLWVANYRNDGTNHPLLGYDPFTQAGVYSNNFSSDNFGVHWDGTHIWVSDTGADLVRKIDPTAGTILATVTVGDRPEAITSGAGSVWVGNQTGNSVSRIDPATNTVTATISAPSGAQVRTVHFALGLCWVGGQASLFGIDPATNTVTVTVASVEAERIIDDGTYLYCLEPSQNRMTKIAKAAVGWVRGHAWG
jgi:YVTN family beta-propeller protein